LSVEVAGASSGDRIEHGGVIPEEAIPQLRLFGLTIVTQPGFIRERGDRYTKNIPPAEHPDLYRCGTLLAAGIPVAAGSDAPYSSPDPWLAIKTAIDRRTEAGLTLGAVERVAASSALELFLKDPSCPDRPARRVAVGAEADLCLLNAPLRAALEEPDARMVRATIIGGRVLYDAA
jgi:predicted amidohydrolase YtcJ